MKCRTCGNEMEIRQTETGKVAICHTCKVKRRLKKKTTSTPQTYSNIPEKEIRKKSEKEVKKNYQEMLSAGSETDTKKKNPIGKIFLIILILSILGVGCFFGYRYYQETLANKSEKSGTATQPADNINVSTSSFVIEYVSHELSTDNEGAPCLLLYYTFTNKNSDISSNALSEVMLSVSQGNSPCPETTASTPIDETQNIALDIQPKESITICQIFRLTDTSDVTISASALLNEDGTILGSQTFSL